MNLREEQWDDFIREIDKNNDGTVRILQMCLRVKYRLILRNSKG